MPPTHTHPASLFKKPSVNPAFLPQCRVRLVFLSDYSCVFLGGVCTCADLLNSDGQMDERYKAYGGRSRCRDERAPKVSRPADHSYVKNIAAKQRTQRHHARETNRKRSLCLHQRWCSHIPVLPNRRLHIEVTTWVHKMQQTRKGIPEFVQCIVRCDKGACGCKQRGRGRGGRQAAVSHCWLCEGGQHSFKEEASLLSACQWHVLDRRLRETDGNLPKMLHGPQCASVLQPPFRVYRNCVPKRRELYQAYCTHHATADVYE